MRHRRPSVAAARLTAASARFRHRRRCTAAAAAAAGKLIAVGVVDVLPRCLSSVYLFWDTELAPLALGRFSALQVGEREPAEAWQCGIRGVGLGPRRYGTVRKQQLQALLICFFL